MKRYLNTQLPRFGVLLAVTLLTGCGLFGDKEEDQPVYYEASETDLLEVPEGLSKPRRDQALLIMGENVPPVEQATSSPEPPRVDPTALSDDPNSAIKYGARGSYLLIEDTVDSVYRRLKFAIERSGMQLVNQYPEQFSYDLYYTDPPRPKPKKGFFKSMLFWKKSEVVDYSGTYRALLEADGKNTRIYLQDTGGQVTSEAVAEAVLGRFLERLG